MSTSLGDQNAIQTDKRFSFTRDGGVNWIYVFEGPEQSAFDKAAELAGNADEVECGKSGNGPRFRTIAKWGRDPNSNPNANDFVNNDELLSSEISQSIFLSPTLRDLLPVSVIAAIKSNVELVTQGTRTYSDATGAVTAACFAATPPISNGNALQVFDDVLQDRASYYTTAYVHRRTLTAARVNAIQAALNNVNLIHTTAQVRSAENTPGGFVLPDGEWRKLAPKVTMALNQKTQITYDYEWAESWNPLYYDYLT
jgi:hypothetical protein